jgi:hypothetical protein
MPNAFTINKINEHGSQQGKSQIKNKSTQDSQNIKKVNMGMPETICHREKMLLI